MDDHIRAGEQLLTLYKPLRKSPLAYANLYFFLFKVAIMRRCTLGKARRYVAAAFREMSLVYGEGDPSELKGMKLLMDHPYSHENYLIME